MAEPELLEAGRIAILTSRRSHSAAVMMVSAFEWEHAGGKEGTLWLDAEHGHIVDAVFPAPNHPGYTDFRLRLDHVSDGGIEEWTNLLTAHFSNCG